MPIGSISPRVVALSLGVAAASGLVAGGVILTTDGSPATADTTATSSPVPTTSHKDKTRLPADADATSSVTAAAEKKDKTKADKAGDKRKKQHSPNQSTTPGTATPGPAASATAPGSSAPSPSASAPPPASTEAPSPSQPAATPSATST